MAKKSTQTNRWIPNLSGRIDPQTDEAIRYLFQAVYSLRDGTGFGPEAKKVLTQIVQPLTLPQILTAAQQALSGGGSHPVDITGSPGVAGSPQPSSVPVVQALPPIGDPLTYVGSRVTYNGLEYVYRNGPDGNPIWVVSVSVGTALTGPYAGFRTTYPPANYPVGTSFRSDEGVVFIIAVIGGVNHWIYQSGYQGDLLANIPGTLVTDDAGYTFSATDYIQQYQWNGTVWHFQTNSGSGYTNFFGVSAPTYGLWGLADGSNYLTSQDDGTIVSKTSPNLGAGYYFRR